MACPRVFVSSTCYDLAQVRDSLVEFIESAGFEPVLSEQGDVLYDPDTHTHESCINEIGKCHLFILIIGGRFGGEYVADPKKSIVNAEYNAACKSDIPVFIFIKSNVYSDHHLYTKNKLNKARPEIIFPSIEIQEQASSIFKFIDDVRHADKNNALFSFNYARDIIDFLRKQWAGMFHDFLEKRAAANEQQVATKLLHNISTASNKVEELVKALYRHIDESGAEEKIALVEQRAAARAFYEIFFDSRLRGLFKDEAISGLIDTPREGKWYEYMAKAMGYTIQRVICADEKGSKEGYKAILGENYYRLVDCEDVTSLESKYSRSQEERFDIIKKMEVSELKKVLEELDLLPDTDVDG